LTSSWSPFINIFLLFWLCDVSDKGDNSFMAPFAPSWSLLCNKQPSTPFKIKVYLNDIKAHLSVFGNYCQHVYRKYINSKLFDFAARYQENREKEKKLDSFRCTYPLVYKANWNLVTKATCTSICETIFIYDLSQTTEQKLTCSPCNQPTDGSEFTTDNCNSSRPVQYILDLGTSYVQRLAPNLEQFLPPEIIDWLIQQLSLLSYFIYYPLINMSKFPNCEHRNVTYKLLKYNI